ncbi:4-hydroxyphenylacetate 3-monooxygenase, oxygenase component [Blastococcus tunisiensis]|uniref:Anthranilate 3-monooxygenase (FAD) / 4-hydroxyphenylacetate 3-monooxygenase n=1 Tax=Blastococcus tunisiensis TaxID=1798228 RepID=A0A1I2MHK6_9ACTN|nr:4-hydroxyphenylacetate 3-monooxygenase, oxygenase component [Blastococcus sp. DSM 46838]SFF90498.1 anthranilate 3-monooxygenase (FAD) / 4-hydroxyphenylacetate 3-monooxygenase [Blastococcus sp. DSM 46838]
MPIRTGAQYIERLRKTPRDVWIRGTRVEDVTTHPALAAPIEQIAHLYDMQRDPELGPVLTRPGPDGPIGIAFVPPRSYEDLVARREAFRVWSEATLGLMGRSPDFLNTTLMAFAEEPAVFEELGPQYARNVQAYFEYVRDNDLFLTHALITPQTDRSRSAGEQQDAFLHMGVVEETSDGLVVRGARMLATLAPMADEMIIYSLPGLRPGDEKHAAVFAVPIDAPGLRLIAREPYDDGSRNSFDHPLSSHFEEADCLVVFDDVLVPWDRVFLHGDVALANAMYSRTNLRQHTGHQTGVRGLVKMQFVTGVAMALCQSVKTDGFLHVQKALGEAIAAVETCRALIVAAETEFEVGANGSVRPRFQALQTLRMHLSSAYPKVVETLQTLGAGGLLMMPSAEDFGSEIAPDIEKYFVGAEGLPAVDRVRLYKLAWDLCGDGFGQRALQYERYYAGDPVRLYAANYLTYDKTDCRRLVDRALELAGDPGDAVAAVRSRAAEA